MKKKAKPKPLPQARVPNELMRFQGTSQAIVEALRHVGGVNERTAKRILESYPSGRGLANATTNNLMHLGATEKQAKQIHYAFKLTTFCDESCQAMADSEIRDEEGVVAFVRSMLGRREQESFGVLIMDSRMKTIEVIIIATGSLSSVNVHPRDIFREAIRLNAHAVILFHNHPSENVEPSEADIDVTKRMVEVGFKVGIPVLDHITVSRSRHAGLRGRMSYLFVSDRP